MCNVDCLQVLFWCGSLSWKRSFPAKLKKKTVGVIGCIATHKNEAATLKKDMQNYQVSSIVVFSVGNSAEIWEKLFRVGAIVISFCISLIFITHGSWLRYIKWYEICTCLIIIHIITVSIRVIFVQSHLLYANRYSIILFFPYFYITFFYLNFIFLINNLRKNTNMRFHKKRKIWLLSLE